MESVQVDITNCYALEPTTKQRKSLYWELIFLLMLKPLYIFIIHITVASIK